MTAVVWFRNDLRIEDNPALAAAAASGLPVLPLFIHEDACDNPWPPGGASRWWLAGSLTALDERLNRLGSRLICKLGDPERIIAQFRPDLVCWNESLEPWVRQRDERIHRLLRRQAVRVERFEASTLFPPGEIRSGSNAPFRIYSAFARACPKPLPPCPGPTALPSRKDWPRSDALALRPSAPDWAAGLRAIWRPGRSGAEARLAELPVAAYAHDRDIPSVAGTSRLSPHLHFGEISVREVWHRLRDRRGAGPDKFRGELLWREFSCHLLRTFPQLPNHPLQPRFRGFPWRPDAEALARWQRGRTGYPIIDAGMRELWHTGWMHNRVRMLAGSLLSKHLLIDWREGARWFWDTLVDADLANNSAGWQWIAGCGTDAAPYFRIFNPVLQGEKFDPQGNYVRRWVRELADLPASAIHKPWMLPHPPDAYPAPVVEHGLGRKRALAAWQSTANPPP